MLKLRLQFFVVMLIIFSLLTTGLYVLIKLSFKRDFWIYIEQKETRFAQPLINDLTRNYREQKNWNWIINWDDYVLAKLEAETREYRRANPKQFGDPVPPPLTVSQNAIAGGQDTNTQPLPSQQVLREWRRMPPMFALKYIFLLDENRQHIAGKNKDIDEAFLIPLVVENKTVGYVGIPFNPAVRDLQDADFAAGQEHKLSLVIFIALVIASLVSFPLAHLLTKRISHLVRQVNAFSQGNYADKVSVKGQDELAELARHLNNLGETLEQSENTRRQWVADISHELRTPIAVLQAELEAVEDGVRPMDKATVGRLISHSQRLKHLVNDLYELSLTDLGGMTYRKNSMDLAGLLQESVDAMRSQFTQANIELIVNLPNSSIPIFGDQHRLQQLFANLLKNSVQYTNSPGSTRVSLETDKENAVIVIEDTAPGVAEEHHHKLFDRLYRADSSRNRSTGGAGLGLSICKNIVTAHDGKITTSNSEMGGLKIIIQLPCSKELV